jgi:peptidoglycan hydrolase CwlO-like protein
MRTLLLNIALLILVTATSCKKNVETNPLNQDTTTKNIVKADINIEYTTIYLSPKARPIIVNWKEYIDVQNKIYDLKNTDTVKLNKQLDELDELITKLLNSQFPRELQTHLFERKLDLLGEAVTNLRNLLVKENTSFDDVKKGVFNIIQLYGASKNQINAIYGG